MCGWVLTLTVAECVDDCYGRFGFHEVNGKRMSTGEPFALALAPAYVLTLALSPTE